MAHIFLLDVVLEHNDSPLDDMSLDSTGSQSSEAASTEASPEAYQRPASQLLQESDVARSRPEEKSG